MLKGKKLEKINFLSKIVMLTDFFDFVGCWKVLHLLINLLTMWKTLSKSPCFFTWGRFFHSLRPELFSPKVRFFLGDKKLCLRWNLFFFSQNSHKKLALSSRCFHKSPLLQKSQKYFCGTFTKKVFVWKIPQGRYWRYLVIGEEVCKGKWRYAGWTPRA